MPPKSTAAASSAANTAAARRNNTASNAVTFDPVTRDERATATAAATVATGLRLSQAIEEHPQLITAAKIILNFKGIELLDALSSTRQQQSLYTSCTSLLLSQNKLRELHGLYPFVNLRSLSLSYNKIENFTELKHIRGEKLESLSLEGNPVAEHPNYRNIVIERFPSLKSLDSRPVKPLERLNIEKGREFERTYLNVMFVLGFLCDDLNRENTSLAIKIELYQRSYGSHSIFCAFDPPDDTDILRKYASRGRCLKALPTVDLVNLLDGKNATAARALDLLVRIVELDVIKKELDSIVSSQHVSDELREQVETFASAVSLEGSYAKDLSIAIASKYEIKKPNRVGFLRQESRFTIYPSDAELLYAAMDILLTKCKEVAQLYVQREQYLSTNMFSLDRSISVKACRDTAQSRKHPAEAWQRHAKEPATPKAQQQSQLLAALETQKLIVSRLLDCLAEKELHHHNEKKKSELLSVLCKDREQDFELLQLENNDTKRALRHLADKSVEDELAFRQIRERLQNAVAKSVERKPAATAVPLPAQPQPSQQPPLQQRQQKPWQQTLREQPRKQQPSLAAALTARGRNDEDDTVLFTKERLGNDLRPLTSRRAKQQQPPVVPKTKISTEEKLMHTETANNFHRARLLRKATKALRRAAEHKKLRESRVTLLEQKLRDRIGSRDINLQKRIFDAWKNVARLRARYRRASKLLKRVNRKAWVRLCFQAWKKFCLMSRTARRQREALGLVVSDKTNDALPVDRRKDGTARIQEIRSKLRQQAEAARALESKLRPDIMPRSRSPGRTQSNVTSLQAQRGGRPKSAPRTR